MSDQYEDEDIILSELPDDELVEQMHDDLYDGLAEEIAEGTNILLGRGWEATRVLEEALVASQPRPSRMLVPSAISSARPS